MGILLLFAPMRFLLLALLPASVPAAADTASLARISRWWFPWAAVAIARVVAGLLLLSAEMFKESGGTTPPVAQVLLVTVVYMGTEVTGLLVGFAMLREQSV